jgi:hypothetical protein
VTVVNNQLIEHSPCGLYGNVSKNERADLRGEARGVAREMGVHSRLQPKQARRGVERESPGFLWNTVALVHPLRVIVAVGV